MNTENVTYRQESARDEMSDADYASALRLASEAGDVNERSE